MRDPSDFDPLCPHYNPEKAAAGDPFPFDTAQCGLVDPDPDRVVDFTPVPRLRKRRNGWTEETQRLFILALSECGCVVHAARVVGKSARTAYRLLEAEGADSFAEAWDNAIALGVERLRADAMGRAFDGAWVPVVRRGRLVRFEHRRNDRLATSLLSGRAHSIVEAREQASSRRKYKLKLKERDRREAEKRARAEAVWAEHQAILDRIEAEKLNPPPPPAPRIRSL